MPLNPEAIRELVLNHFNLPANAFEGRLKIRGITFPRYVVAYCLWHYTELSHAEIAVFINRDRTIVTIAIPYITNMCLRYDDVKKQVIEIETKITQL